MKLNLIKLYLQLGQYKMANMTLNGKNTFEMINGWSYKDSKNVHATCVASNCINVEVGRKIQCKDNVIFESVDLMTMGIATAVHNGGVK